MRVTLKNDWVVEISDVLLEDLSPEESRLIGKLVLTNLVVVVKDQNMTPDEQVRFCNTLGKVERYHSSKRKIEMSKDLSVGDGVARITGAKNERGARGMFPDKDELIWHADGCEKHNRNSIVWLHAIQGSAGSVTSWNNTAMAYRDLPENAKEAVRGMKIFTKSPDVFPLYQKRSRSPFDVYMKNDAGVEGMYYPHLFVDKIIGIDLHDYLVDFLFQPKYIYDHEWEDGDVVLSEQWLTTHMRHYCENIETRVLNRIGLKHDKVLNA
jgi:taurine dioxygenase